MAVKVVFPTNTSSITVAGLYQWDYGQTLEIECSEIGSEIVEVHFACTGMTEAIVRPCTFSGGVGTVIIPDRCLEQTSPITAWIYKVDSTAGHTIKTITLPLTARTRPGKAHDIPTKYVDKYAELITEINEAVNDIEKGNITAMFATSADTAAKATTADSAKNATYATSAGSATTAGRASTAEQASRAHTLMVSPDFPYCSITLSGGKGSTDTIFNEGLYLVIYDTGGTILSGVGYIGANEALLNKYLIALGKVSVVYEEVDRELGGAKVSLIHLSDSNPVITDGGTLKFIKIGSISHG